MKLQIWILAGVALLATATTGLAQSAVPQREITQIRGDVYNFRNIGHCPSSEDLAQIAV